MKILAIGVAVFYLFGLKLSSEINTPAKQTEAVTIKANAPQKLEIRPQETINPEKPKDLSAPKDTSLITTESATKSKAKGS